MPSAKRRRVVADELPELLKPTEVHDCVKAKCEVIATALGKATNLPQACREMLAAGAEMSLGISCCRRDSRQAKFAGLIGEALGSIEASLAAQVRAAEVASRPEVAAAAAALEGATSQVAVAKACLLEATEALSHSRAELKAAEDKARAAALAAEQAEAARSYGEGDLLAYALERDLCQAGSTMLLTGGCLQASTSSSPTAEVNVAALQKVASKLGLEDSLLITLPIVVQKPLGSRSLLDRAAAEMLAAALSKHAAALEERLGNGGQAIHEHGAAVEATRAACREAEQQRASCASAVAESEAECFVRQSTQDAETSELRRCQSELQMAQSSIMAAEEELERFRRGPLAMYRELLVRADADSALPVAELGA